MAGRGTDIVLAPGVAACGGLHVIVCQHNDARRIDRQLIGRGARQGDPGSAETWLAADHPRL
jgi:preprotein translocase subunit SecA